MRSLLLIAAMASGSIFLTSCKTTTETTPVVSTYRVVAPSEAMPHGKSWNDWLALWTGSWARQMPYGHSTIDGTAPADTLQYGHGHDSVWFLCGYGTNGISGATADTTRTITVPRGTSFFFPIYNLSYDNWGDTSYAQIVSDSIAITAGFPTPPDFAFKGVEMTAEIDGVSVSGLDQYYFYTHTPFLEHRADPPIPNMAFPYANDHMQFLATVGGYYIFVDSLSPGQHTIHFSTKAPSLLMNVTYKITVQ